MKTAIVISQPWSGPKVIELVGNASPKGYDWWKYGGIRVVFPSVESAMQFATANGNRYSGKFIVDPWGQWVAA